MPSREAVLRSMSTASRSPLSCWSLLTSRSSGRSLKRLDQLGGPGVQLIGVGVFQGILVLGAAHPGIDGEVLHRLHEERDPFDLRQFRLKSPDDLAGARLSALPGASG